MNVAIATQFQKFDLFIIYEYFFCNATIAINKCVYVGTQAMLIVTKAVFEKEESKCYKYFFLWQREY